jgi:dolichol kinase
MILEKMYFYFWTLAVILISTVVALAYFNEKHLSVYIGFFVTEYFTCSLIYRPRNIMSNLIGATLVGVWVITALLNVLNLGF